MLIKERNEIIRNRYQNGARLPELALDFDIPEFEVMLIIEMLSDFDPEYLDSVYDSREKKCGKCGSAFDADDNPTDCTGDCEVKEESYYIKPRGDDDPQELDFNDY